MHCRCCEFWVTIHIHNLGEPNYNSEDAVSIRMYANPPNMNDVSPNSQYHYICQPLEQLPKVRLYSAIPTRSCSNVSFCTCMSCMRLTFCHCAFFRCVAQTQAPLSLLIAHSLRRSRHLIQWLRVVCESVPNCALETYFEVGLQVVLYDKLSLSFLQIVNLHNSRTLHNF